MSNYGIIGWPLEKTYSPIIQNYLFNMNNLDSKYQPFKIENLTTESVDTLIADLNGFNITIPHKEKCWLVQSPARERVKENEKIKKTLS